MLGFMTTGTIMGTALAVLIPALAAAQTPDGASVIVEGDGGPNILIGFDTDNINNPTIQPPGTAANQSLNNTDILIGEGGNDVMAGLLGNDLVFGEPGNDILIGGPEQGTTPNSDIIAGDEGNDVNIWAPGDGSDLFIGGPGTDAIIFGVIDKNAQNIPTSNGPAPGFAHIPGVNVTGSPGFCTIERVNDPSLGYEFLARFFVRATGALAVTVRLIEVEQMFCTSQAGGQITGANLNQANPQLVVISLAQVAAVNDLVSRIIR
jgi:Ca2+-binding RTX toxin-like protein